MKVPGLILVLLLPFFAEAQQRYYGTKVSSLALSGAESQADLQILPIQVGDTITVENVRASIQALIDTGHYGQVEVDAEPADNNTTRLTFRVRPVFFFSTFRIEPDDLLSRPISSYIRLPFGERFTTSAVDRVVQQTKDLLQGEGYFRAAIQTAYESDETNHLVFVTLKVMPGVRAVIGMVQIEGDQQTFTQKELADAFGLKRGDNFSQSKVDKGRSDLRAKFTELRFINTRVTADKTFNESTNTVDLKVTIQPGQFALVQARGFDISAKKLRDLVPIFEEATVDPDLIEEGRVNITRFMQQEGYFEATVTYETIEVAPALGNAIQVIYNITPQAKHVVKDVVISGNRHFETDDIRKRIKSRRGELGHAVFSADLLEEDRRTIEAMYRNAGFEGTVVTTRAVDVGHELTVYIEISEGKQLTIESVDMIGNVNFPTQELKDALIIRPGDPYTPGGVDQARATLTQFYYTRGYPDVRVERTVDRVEGTDGVRVTFQITEGQRYLIGMILVEGSTLTRDKLVRRSSGLKEYTEFNPEAVLEAQQRLYATGLFSRVEIVALDQGFAGLRNVLIQVEDAKPILLTYGVGYQEFDHFRGTFEITHNNLFGLNRSITFRLRGSRRERLAQATYHEPRLFNHELDGFASSFIEHSQQPFFSANRIDFSLQVLKRFTDRTNLLMSSGYQTVNIGDRRVNPHAVNDPAQQGPCSICQIGRFTTSFIHDRRNDPVNPRTGTFNTTTFQVAAPPFGSELNFTSLFHGFNYYFPWRSGVVASALRFGWNHPFGKTAQFATVWNPTTESFVTQTQQLPATERYWAGGSTTLRGFSLDNARPSSDLGLQGGNALTLANVEYRVPVRAPIENVGAAVFYDAGNVFQGFHQISFGQFSHTVGVGLRYQTPVGPARLDFGFNLAPIPNPDGTRGARMKVFFTLGNAF